MELRILQVEIRCVDDMPRVFIIETGEELEVVYGNFEDAIFVRYLDDEYLVDIDYPCAAGGEGVLHLEC